MYIFEHAVYVQKHFMNEYIYFFNIACDKQNPSSGYFQPLDQYLAISTMSLPKSWFFPAISKQEGMMQ